MRSAIGQIAGMHLQGGITREVIRQYGLRNWTVLHMQADVLQVIAEEIPDFTACLRLYDEDWRTVDPRIQGGKMFDYAARFLRPHGPNHLVTPANEQNIEHNRVVQSGRDYEDIRDWCLACIESYDADCARYGFRPARTCAPALSPGHSEDQEDIPGVIGYQILKPAWDKYDVIGVHCYWDSVGSPELHDPATARYYAYRNVQTYRQWYPDKTCWWGEVNCGGVVNAPWLQQAHAAEVRMVFAYAAAHFPWCEGVTYFLDESWDQPYQVRRMPPVFDEFCRIGHETAQDVPPSPAPPAPGPVPPPGPVPSGDDGGWTLAFADYYREHPEIGPATGPICYVPNSWQCAAQESDTTLLIWDGAAVHQLERAK